MQYTKLRRAIQSAMRRYIIPRNVTLFPQSFTTYPKASQLTPPSEIIVAVSQCRKTTYGHLSLPAAQAALLTPKNQKLAHKNVPKFPTFAE